MLHFCFIYYPASNKPVFWNQMLLSTFDTFIAVFTPKPESIRLMNCSLLASGTPNEKTHFSISFLDVSRIYDWSFSLIKHIIVSSLFLLTFPCYCRELWRIIFAWWPWWHLSWAKAKFSGRSSLWFMLMWWTVIFSRSASSKDSPQKKHLCLSSLESIFSM